MYHRVKSRVGSRGFMDNNTLPSLVDGSGWGREISFGGPEKGQMLVQNRAPISSAQS